MTERFGLPAIMLGATGIIIFVVIGAVLVFVNLSNRDKEPEPRDVRITVEELVNQVESDRPRGTGPFGRFRTSGFSPAVVGQTLIPGDGIKTFANSEARVDVALGPLTRITRTTPNTIWRLGRFALENGVIIELTQGKVFLVSEAIDKPSQPVKIVTPAGTASPRGTWMSVSYDPEIGVAELQCLHGECILENRAGLQLLTNGEKSIITPQSSPTAPGLMTQDDILGFLQLPEAQTSEAIGLIGRLGGTLMRSAPVVAMLPTPTPSPRPAPSQTLEPGPNLPPPPTPQIEPTLTPIPTPMPSASSALAPLPATAPIADKAADPTPAPFPTPTPAPSPVPSPTPQPTPHTYATGGSGDRCLAPCIYGSCQHRRS